MFLSNDGKDIQFIWLQGSPVNIAPVYPYHSRDKIA